MRSHVCKNVLRLAGELSIVRVLNDFQPLLILRISRAREIELYPSVTP
ncbi:TPA: capsid protein [Escherichia coli]|nr:capsid protein [Escherichia coli]MDY8701119.1 capsid protein [Escherichia coli]MDY8751519.1 capsid protein [Escherichia coli]MDY8848694.1 capsid protein [Escherichia coli]RLY13643.1 capsid protein [Escherichia coli]